MSTEPKNTEEAKDYSWVEERRPGNRRIVWYIVAFCLSVLAFSGWSFIRFMETRTGYSRADQVQQSEDV